MPHTLMIGWHGAATITKVAMDSRELEDCRWFNRTEAAALLNRNLGVVT